jgi:hypothetical protein
MGNCWGGGVGANRFVGLTRPKRLERQRDMRSSLNPIALNPIFARCLPFPQKNINDPTYAACVLEDQRGTPILQLLKPRSAMMRRGVRRWSFACRVGFYVRRRRGLCILRAFISFGRVCHRRKVSEMKPNGSAVRILFVPKFAGIILNTMTCEK